MGYLLDTSIICRLANTSDPQYVVAGHAAVELHRRGEILYVSPQVMIEFRNVATRPKSVNGLGLSAAVADSLVTSFENRFAMLAETSDVYPAWKALVSALGVIGKQVHDARHVAVCHVHGVTHVLTFNVSHFVRLSGVAPGIVVVDPAIV